MDLSTTLVCERMGDFLVHLGSGPGDSRLKRAIHMPNDTGAETQVRSIEDAGAPDSNVNEDTRSPAAADAGASDSATSEDARSPAPEEGAHLKIVQRTQIPGPRQ